MKRKKTTPRGALSPVQKERYLLDQACPWCRCQNFPDGGEVALEGGVAKAFVTCPNCGACWREVYQLVRIEDLELPGLKLVHAEEGDA